MWDFDIRTNYVHRDDVVGIIVHMICLGIRRETFDVVSPIQLTKQDIFDQNAQHFGFTEHVFRDAVVEGKNLSLEKMMDRLGYTFMKEDVRTFCIYK